MKNSTTTPVGKEARHQFSTSLLTMLKKYWLVNLLSLLCRDTNSSVSWLINSRLFMQQLGRNPAPVEL